MATPSGETEYYALTRAAAEALGLQSVARDFGVNCTVRIWVDPSAAKAMASRAGLGRTRHLEVRFLWVQEAVKSKRLEIRKIKGTANPSDIATKPMAMDDLIRHLSAVGGRIVRRVLVRPDAERRRSVGGAGT